jgi:hypothetical protein
MKASFLTKVATVIVDLLFKLRFFFHFFVNLTNGLLMFVNETYEQVSFYYFNINVHTRTTINLIDASFQISLHSNGYFL